MKLPGAMLVLEDDASFARAACELLMASGVEAVPARTCAEARAAVSERPFDGALIDIGLPDGCGLDLLHEQDFARVEKKIVMSGDQALAASLAQVLPGTICLGKPFTSASLRAALNIRASNDIRAVPGQAETLLGQSLVMRAVRRELNTVATLDLPVLLHGESGTGKELAARHIHDASGRRGRFVAINAAALAPDLLASQLFGHVRGSFTGAHENRHGLVRAAEGGTLFIDELADMPAPVQAALLRFLESREVIPLGATEGKVADVRIVSATNRVPREAIASGHLRADLYFRLAGYEARLPALRERPSDIPLLSSRILAELNERAGTARRFAAHAFEQVAGYAWPGNVRELRQVVQRAYVCCVDELRLDLPGSLASGAPHGIRRLADIEHDAIMGAIAACDGDRARAARVLGISVRTIYNRLAEYRVRHGSGALQ
jgi:DNA-binding NtrC family response regulator